MDLIVWEPVVKTCLNLSPKVLPEVDIGAISGAIHCSYTRWSHTDSTAENLPDPSTPAAANVLATKSHSAEVPVRSKLVVSPFQHLRVPELDWSTPGIPTVKALKAMEAEPEPTHLDLWFFDFYVGADGSILLKDDDTLDQLLAGPDDDTVHAWQYVTPMLKFERVCLRKGVYPYVGEARAGFIIGVRWAVLLLTLYTLGTWIAPIPRNLRRAWRAFKSSRRPLRAHRHRRRRHRQ